MLLGMRPFLFSKSMIILVATLVYALNSSAEIARISEVTTGIFRSSQPTTAADFAALAGQGIKTIIDLQWDEEQYATEKKWAASSGLEDFHYPMSGAVYPSVDQVGQILSMMKKAAQDPKSGSILIHCKEGRDRTGLIIALYRIHVMGWPAERARAEMLAMGFHRLYLGLEAYWQTHSGPGDQPIP